MLMDKTIMEACLLTETTTYVDTDWADYPDILSLYDRMANGLRQLSFLASVKATSSVKGVYKAEFKSMSSASSEIV